MTAWRPLLRNRPLDLNGVEKKFWQRVDLVLLVMNPPCAGERLRIRQRFVQIRSGFLEQIVIFIRHGFIDFSTVHQNAKVNILPARVVDASIPEAVPSDRDASGHVGLARAKKHGQLGGFWLLQRSFGLELESLLEGSTASVDESDADRLASVTRVTTPLEPNIIITVLFDKLGEGWSRTWWNAYELRTLTSVMNRGSDNHPLLGLEVRRRTGLDHVIEVFIDLLTNGLPDVTVGLPGVFFRSGRRSLHSLTGDQLRDR